MGVDKDEENCGVSRIIYPKAVLKIFECRSRTFKAHKEAYLNLCRRNELAKL